MVKMNRILDNELLSNQDEQEETKHVGEGDYKTITPKCEIEIDEEPGSVTP
jgi:hypothetical protein